MIRISNLKIDGVDVPLPDQSALKKSIKAVIEQPGPLLSVTEFAKEAHVSRQAVHKMIADKKVNSYKVGNQYSIPKEELIKYLQIN